ncbi:MAG: peroxiredoxin [Candidatus Dadabacteria bacterium]|nr:peroxiredoxin [Candidatus Dadabacteria bacterium]
MSDVLNVGDKAPAIKAETYGGDTVSLGDFTGNNVVVLYFYPRDNTPGCTKEACSLRDGMGELHDMGVQVLGVSTDSVKSHEKFRDKYALNFPLLSDGERKIVKDYGVESERGSARRMTFLIDKGGVIRHIWTKVNTAAHADEVIAKIKELGLS